MKRILLLAALCFTQSVCSTVTTIHTPKWQVEVTHGPLSEEIIEVVATDDGELIQARVTKRTDAAGVAAIGTAAGGVLGAAAILK